MSISTLLPAPVGVLLTAMADVQVKLSAMIAFSLQLGLPALSISAQLALAATITASLEASIGITPPSISAQLEITLAVIAQLRLLLQIYIDLFALLTASVRVYAYDGTVAGMGATLTTALAAGFPGGTGSAQHCNALIIATELDASWAAMSAVFRVA